MRRAVALALLLVIGWAAASRPAQAHGRSRSFSSWELDGRGARVRVRILRLELMRLLAMPAAEASAAAQLTRWLRLTAEERPCVPVGAPAALGAPEEWTVFEWRVACPADGELRIDAAALFARAPAHIHFARLGGPGGGVVERVLTEADPSWWVDAESAEENARTALGTSLGGYIGLGIEHILSGWDHLAFVLALLLLATSLGQVAALVTAFTVAHSATLGLAVLGVVQPDAASVEALIGFSIALVAAENGWLLGGRDRVVPAVATGGLLALALTAAAGLGVLAPVVLVGLALFTGCHFGLLARVARPAPLRVAVAFAFGLIHGFGFAGVVAEMKLPTERVVPALFGFNVGVELGQLAVVIAVWPLLRLLARAGSGRAYVGLAQVGSATICALGLFWFTARLF